MAVSAGITVRVIMDRYRSDRVDGALPKRFVFKNVGSSEHPIEIQGVVGSNKIVSVIVEPTPLVDALLLLWLGDWVKSLDAREVEFPPDSITILLFQGAEVYYVALQYCGLVGRWRRDHRQRGGVTKFSPLGLEAMLSGQGLSRR